MLSPLTSFRPLAARVCLAGDDVVALEADDQRQLEADLPHRLDDAGGDDVAVHDAAEDVDEDALHLRVGRG